MPEIIIGSPNQHMMAVNNSGAVPIAGYSGGTIYPLVVDNAGRLMTSNVWLESLPTDSNVNNPAYEFVYITSGTTTGVTGSSIGSIWQTIGVGSYVQILSWSNDLITNVGSWGT